ncbi:hypothetical protein K438DRAFT_1808757, partial [Mycena galopus ATCC 62051]
MPNPTGSNGRTPQEYLADDVLLKAFTKYAQENSRSGLEWKDQLVWSKQDFNLDIGQTTLFKLCDRVNAPSVRKATKTLHPAVVSQEVADIKQNDALGLWELANEKILITQKRKKDKHRTLLYALGPWHQEHMDGHEKLGEQALQIGKGIHLPIYASKDQFSPFLHLLVLMPNVRNSDTITYFYLDLVEGRGYLISIQVTVDGGVKVVEMVKIHKRLRCCPSYYRWKQNGKECLRWSHPVPLGGSSGMRYQVAMSLVVPGGSTTNALFYWIWVPFIQECLDIFRDYWNNHQIRKSKNKQNTSGSSLKNMLLNPQAGG